MILISGVGALLFAFRLLLSQLPAVPSADPVFSVLPANTQEEDETLEFPFSIPGTTLVAEQIVSYDGLFAENGASRYTVNTAALLLYNCGDENIAAANVTLLAGKVCFVFELDTLPAGERVLVPEKNGLEFGPKTFTECTGTQENGCADWLNGELINMEFPDMGVVVLNNLSGETVASIRLYYKTYYAEGNFCVGGSAFVYTADGLNTNEYMQIYPHNYAYGYSKILRIEAVSP